MFGCQLAGAPKLSAPHSGIFPQAHKVPPVLLVGRSKSESSLRDPHCALVGAGAHLMGKKRKADELVVDKDFVAEGLDSDPLAFLVASKSAEQFTDEFWEQQPLHLHASDDRRKFFQGLFDIKELKAFVKQREKDLEAGPLQFGTDLNAVRYIDGARETPNGEVADSKTVATLFKDGCTFQVHQPQRFNDQLWRLVAALERQLGCLVGVNAYITPANAQGLAPHYDDVELWVCQTQGSKRWRLYKSPNGFNLPSLPSGDFEEGSLGEPIMDVTLQVGDVLYLPRGTVHQAVASKEGSSHLTISTYQAWNWGTLAHHVLSVGLASSSEDSAVPIELRQSVPFGFLSSCGLQAELLGTPGQNNAHVASAAAKLAAGLRKLAGKLESDPHALVPAATDSLAADFFRSRIPPHPKQILQPSGPRPTLDHSIQSRGDGLFMIVPVKGHEDPEVPEGFVKLCTPLFNARESHMMGLPESEDEDDSEDEGEDDSGDAEDDDVDVVHGRGGKAMNGTSKVEQLTKHTGTKAKHKGAPPGSHKPADDAQHSKQQPPHSKMNQQGNDENSDDEEEEEEEGEEENDSEEDEDEDDLTCPGYQDELPGPVVPASYASVVAEIFAATKPPGISVRSLLSKVPHKDEQELLHLVFVLWSEGFVCTLPQAVPAEKQTVTFLAKAFARHGAAVPARKNRKST